MGRGATADLQGKVMDAVPLSGGRSINQRRKIRGFYKSDKLQSSILKLR